MRGGTPGDGERDEPTEHVAVERISEERVVGRNGRRRLELRRQRRETRSAQTASGPSVGIRFDASEGLEGHNLPSDATASIWVGALAAGTPPTPLENEQLAVDVTRPDGTVESFSVTTDANGRAPIQYDLSTSARGAGEYEATVTATNRSGVTASTTAQVGPGVTFAGSLGSPVMYTDEPVTLAFLAYDGESPRANVTLDVTVTFGPGSILEDVSRTTDANGIATLTVTPQGPVEHEIEVREDGDLVASMTADATDWMVVNNWELRHAITGRRNVFGGYLESGAGPVSGTDLVIELYTDYHADERLLRRTVTTDDGGFFALEYDLPASVDENLLRVVAETPGGDDVPIEYLTISVDDPTSGSVQEAATSTVDLTASVSASSYAPGQTATVEVSATADGDPLADQTVTSLARLTSDGPPVHAGSATTDGAGQAEIDLPIPPEVPDHVDLDVTVATTVDGTTRTVGERVPVKRYETSVDVPRMAPGTTETVSMSVTDVSTGGGAAGVRRYVSLFEGLSFLDVHDTALLESGADGTDSVSIDVPNGIHFTAGHRFLHRYETSTSSGTFMEHPGTISSDGPVVAGALNRFSFDAPGDPAIHCMAFDMKWLGDRMTYLTRFEGPGSFSLRVPRSFDPGDDAFITVWGFDDQGNRYADELEVKIDSEAPPLLAERWRTNVGTGFQHSGLATDGSRVFVGGMGTDLFALSATDGSQEWTVPRSGQLSDSTPAVDGGRVYVGSGGGVLYALDAASGTEEWSVAAPGGATEPDSAIVSTPAVADGSVYVGSNDGTVESIAVADGSSEWRRTLDAAVYSQPAVENGRVHVATADGTLVTLDASDGSERWRLETGADLGHTGPIVDGGTVYLAADQLYALDAASGSQSWTAPFGGSSGSTPTLANGTLYVGSSDGSVSAIDADGTTAWTVPASGTVAADPAVAGGRVIVASVDGTLAVLDAGDGSEVASTALGARTRSSPLVRDGDVYVATRDGDVVSLANVTGSP